MRTVTMLNWVTVDGYYTSFDNANGGMDWVVRDPAVDQAAHEGDRADTLILGSTTFKLFERSWVPFLTDPNAPEAMKSIADELTNLKKIVFSHSLTSSEWANTEFHDGDVAAEVRKLKQADGDEIMIMGSGSIVQQLSNERLIDRYRLIMTPMVIGAGKSLFSDVNRLGLTLLDVRTFDSGNVLLTYGLTNERDREE